MIFDNAESSWNIFTLLEAFSDGYGGWRIMDVLGKPLVELDDGLVSDLLNWRHITGTMRIQIANKKAKNATK